MTITLPPGDDKLNELLPLTREVTVTPHTRAPHFSLPLPRGRARGGRGRGRGQDSGSPAMTSSQFLGNLADPDWHSSGGGHFRGRRPGRPRIAERGGRAARGRRRHQSRRHRWFDEIAQKWVDDGDGYDPEWGDWKLRTSSSRLVKNRHRIRSDGEPDWDEYDRRRALPLAKPVGLAIKAKIGRWIFLISWKAYKITPPVPNSPPLIAGI